MEAGQFAFTVTADAETAAKLGLKTDKDAYAVAAADDGKADLVDLIGGAAESDVKFTDADAGKTYRFTVTETKLGGEGYTNDTAPRTVTIAPGYDAATGKLTVTTTVAGDGVEVARSEVSSNEVVSRPPRPVRSRRCSSASTPITSHMPEPWSHIEAPERIGGSPSPPFVLDRPLKACSSGS